MITSFSIKTNQETNLGGIVYREKLLNLIKGKTIFDPDEFTLVDVIGDDNRGYRAISLQIYSNEDYHYDIRNNVYTYLSNRKDLYKEYNFENFL